MSATQPLAKRWRTLSDQHGGHFQRPGPLGPLGAARWQARLVTTGPTGGARAQLSLVRCTLPPRLPKVPRTPPGCDT
jgi:hypothetical protein